jgi:Flp pilus assembly protein TadB
MKALRLALALAGFLVALVSVAWNDRRLGWGAIALLTGSLILRLALRGRDDRHSGGGT